MRKTIDHVNQMAAASPEQVFEAIHGLMHSYRARQFREGGGEPTHLEGKVLGYFARHPGATQRDLGAHSGRDKGQLARLIGGLRERGLLDAQVDEADRRSVRLQLSAAGKSVLKSVERRGQRLADDAMRNFSAEDRGRLLALLTRLRDDLDAQR